jgi:hypothetical protein
VVVLSRRLRQQGQLACEDTGGTSGVPLGDCRRGFVCWGAGVCLVQVPGRNCNVVLGVRRAVLA